MFIGVFLLEVQEPDVKILSLTIISAGRDDIVLQIPESGNQKGLWFTLKEGSKYNLKFSIKVSNDIVCGLKYTNTVWKTGIKGKYLPRLSKFQGYFRHFSCYHK